MKITKQRLKEIIKEELSALDPDELSDEDVLGVTEPHHEAASPHEKLVTDLFLRLKTDPAGALEAIYGGEVPEDVAQYVEELRAREMLNSPAGME